MRLMIESCIHLVLEMLLFFVSFENLFRTREMELSVLISLLSHIILALVTILFFRCILCFFPFLHFEALILRRFCWAHKSLAQGNLQQHHSFYSFQEKI